jgi:hypothetical protein
MLSHNQSWLSSRGSSLIALLAHFIYSKLPCSRKRCDDAILAFVRTYMDLTMAEKLQSDDTVPPAVQPAAAPR